MGSTLEILALVFSGIFSVTLSIVAFFSMKTLDKISKVELKITELVIRHDNTEERSRDNKKQINMNYNEVEKLRYQINDIDRVQASLRHSINKLELGE